MVCEKCGHDLPESSVFCNKCGASISSELKSTTEEIVLEKKNQSNKKRLLLFGIPILSIIILVGAYWVIKEIQENKIVAYKEDLSDIVGIMVSDLATSEEIINFYLEAWRLDINAVSDMVGILTDKDTNEIVQIEMVTPKYINTTSNNLTITNGFQGAIEKIHQIYTEAGDMQTISNNKRIIKDKFSLLKNPPDEHQKLYELVLEIYKDYEKYISLAENPSGSYLSFKDEAQNLSEKVISKIKEYQIRSL